jgi:ankyrin repeat protein
MVQALLDAGVAPDTGVRTLNETPLFLAVTTGCSSQGQETDWLVETVRHLLAAGADLTLHDDNNNTALTHAAHECGPRIVELLVAGGAKVSGRNGSGLSPLRMALVMGNLDAAEVLVKKGARLAGEELAMVKASVTDARGKALVRNASGGH